MTPHNWIHSVWDGYAANESYDCSRCGALNTAFPELGSPGPEQFLPCGCESTNLSDDCDAALHWIIVHRHNHCPYAECLKCGHMRQNHTTKKRPNKFGACIKFLAKV